MRFTAQLCDFLETLLAHPRKTWVADEAAEQSHLDVNAVRRYFKTLIDAQWVASGLELKPAGGTGQRRRTIYRMTDYGLREAAMELERRRPRR